MKRMEKMLVVEKSCGWHKNHIDTRNIVLNKLDSLKQKYNFVNDRELSTLDINQYRDVLTLGGDGTFIHSAKHLVSQRIIGVNSNPEKSVGFLLNFDKDNIESFLGEYLNGNYKENNLARLGARINDKDLEYLALNEILIGDTDIRHTSHLDISVCDMSGYVRGNGIVVSTKQGSNAFFKSAGATPFDVNGIGYALILPYSIDGNLEKSKVCDLKKKFEISPRRSGYKLAFDCDDSRSYDLNEEDKVEVFVDLKNPLKVVRGN